MRDSTSTANRAVPAQAILRRPTPPRGPSRPRRPRVSRSRSSRRARAALLAGGAFDDEDAVEMVRLVLDHARLETLGLVLEAPAAQVASRAPARRRDARPEPSRPAG